MLGGDFACSIDKLPRWIGQNGVEHSSLQFAKKIDPRVVWLGVHDANLSLRTKQEHTKKLSARRFPENCSLLVQFSLTILLAR